VTKRLIGQGSPASNRDATYALLAEALGPTLVTTDDRLTTVRSANRPVEVFGHA
jgi:predicted nucleic acid-binding protein